MDSAFIPAHLAAKFHAAEAAKEASIRADTELLNAVIEARTDLKVSAPAAQKILGAIVESITLTGKSQEGICQAHTSAEALGRKLGLRTSMTGVWYKEGKVADEDRTVADKAA